ncbi:MAG TPA: DUF1127 domain-containing protein [Devosia sp.]|nr:DUF1127 domain-containing protein [Devosia sp.]
MDLLASLRRRMERHRAYDQLMQLDDRLLRDVGFTRADLRSRMLDLQFADIVGSHARS